VVDHRFTVCASLGLCLALLACKKGQPESGTDSGPDAGATELTPRSALCAGQCKQSGKCAEKVTKTVEMVGGRPEVRKASTCIATSDGECKAADDCRTHGDCALTDPGECRPKNDADCLNSERCKTSGNCTKASVCAVTNAKDCSGEVCTKNGLCKFVSLSSQHGRCEPASAADCKKSARCRTEGACAAMKGGSHGGTVCGAASDADCKAAAICKNEQRCRQGKAIEDFACVR
jgi:hypothetical protein